MRRIGYLPSEVCVQRSIVSGTVGGILGSKAQNKATEQNMRAAQETNALNYRLFQEGRGSTGSAFLPLYFGDQEKLLGQDAVSFYNTSKDLLGNPADQAQRYKQITGGYMPMVDASRGTLADVFNGNLTNNRLGYLQPVQAARTNVAKAGAEGVLQALNERINALNASSAKKGYSGTGSFAQNRLLNATIPARQQAAGFMAMADLENAMDTRTVQDQGAQARLQYMDMPFQQAQQALNLEMMPLAQVQQNFSRQLQPFEFFRMGPQTFQADPLPMVGADTTWPAVMNSIGNFNKQLAGLYLSGAFGGGGGGGTKYDISANGTGSFG